MIILDSPNFDFLSSRLHCIDFTADPILNVELWHSLTAFENHVFGVILQYSRVSSDLEVAPESHNLPALRHHAGLDTYYYVLTWDKLGKIYCKLKSILSRVRQSNPAIPKEFWQEFKVLSKRAGHLFSEFEIAARNEYEHPSLEPYAVGNVIMWGSMMIDGSGDITAHVGATKFGR